MLIIKFSIIDTKTGKEDVVRVDHSPMTLGRHHKNDLVLDSKTVSRNHAEILHLENDYFLVDLESGNGTLLNGKKIKPNEKNLLCSGDTIRIEDLEITPYFAESAELEENTDSGIIEIKMIKKVLSALDASHYPSLEGVVPPIEGKKVYFTDEIQEIVLGRDPSCAFPIDDHVISRRHAVLQKKWGGLTLTDLKSKNATFVNNQQIDEKLLHDGDTIMLGNIKLVFKNPQEIDFEALSKEYEPKVESIKNNQPVQASDTQGMVSEEAHLSVQKNEPDEEPLQESEPETKPPEIQTQTTERSLKQSTSFSSIELILMAVGVAIFIGTLLALVMLVF